MVKADGMDSNGESVGGVDVECGSGSVVMEVKGVERSGDAMGILVLSDLGRSRKNEVFRFVLPYATMPSYPYFLRIRYYMWFIVMYSHIWISFIVRRDLWEISLFCLMFQVCKFRRLNFKEKSKLLPFNYPLGCTSVCHLLRKIVRLELLCQF